MGYLIENNYLRGDAAVDALGWAEERREELDRAEEAGGKRDKGAGAGNAATLHLG